MTEPDLTALAAEAYVYGFPLVFDLDEVRRFTEIGMGSLSAGPFNSFSHARKLAGPEDTFVTVNNDTVYSVAQLDLGGGPLVLHVPATDDRYYVLQFVDAWTNNFAYVGRRATGTGAGDFLLTPPGWDGPVPPGMTRIPVPTRLASIVGRFACDGADDLPAVAALQRALTLGRAEAGGPAPEGVPDPEPAATEELGFFAKLRRWMAAFPPSPAERALQERFAPLGLTGTVPSLADPPAELARALTAGFATGRERVEAATRGGAGGATDGWSAFLHVFDYNVDALGLGTIDAPEWKIADRSTAHLTRAVAARVGLWGNHGYEACYAQRFVDADGQPLRGDARYEIRFAEPPPVDAFWSLTMYDVPDYFLVANSIGRYSIGDRTPGLRPDDDGTLAIRMQRDEPDDEVARANWLPTPEGAFRPLIRLYQPRAAVLDGTYTLPPIRRLA